MIDIQKLTPIHKEWNGQVSRRVAYAIARAVRDGYGVRVLANQDYRGETWGWEMRIDGLVAVVSALIQEFTQEVWDDEVEDSG